MLGTCTERMFLPSSYRAVRSLALWSTCVTSNNGSVPADGHDERESSRPAQQLNKEPRRRTTAYIEFARSLYLTQYLVLPRDIPSPRRRRMLHRSRYRRGTYSP